MSGEGGNSQCDCGTGSESDQVYTDLLGGRRDSRVRPVTWAGAAAGSSSTLPKRASHRSTTDRRSAPTTAKPTAGEPATAEPVTATAAAPEEQPAMPA